MRFLTDGKRHLVCDPYTEDGLHAMARELGLDRRWFHRGRRGLAHYDIPVRRQAEIEARCETVQSRGLVELIRAAGGARP